jgi:hypothetical protein
LATDFGGGHAAVRVDGSPICCAASAPPLCSCWWSGSVKRAAKNRIRSAFRAGFKLVTLKIGPGFTEVFSNAYRKRLYCHAL